MEQPLDALTVKAIVESPRLPSTVDDAKDAILREDKAL